MCHISTTAVPSLGAFHTPPQRQMFLMDLQSFTVFRPSQRNILLKPLKLGANTKVDGQVAFFPVSLKLLAVLGPLDPSTPLVDVEQRHLRISVPDHWHRRGSPAPTEEPTRRESTLTKPSPELDSTHASSRSTLSGLFGGWRLSNRYATEVQASRRWSVSEPWPTMSEDTEQRASRFSSHEKPITTSDETTNPASLNPSDELAFQAMMV